MASRRLSALCHLPPPAAGCRLLNLCPSPKNAPLAPCTLPSKPAAPACAKAPVAGASNSAHICCTHAAVTWDDSINPFSYSLVQDIVGGFKQRNHCPVPSTFFISTKGRRGVWLRLCVPACCVLAAPPPVANTRTTAAACFADTVAAAVQALYLAGNEIASHTINHIGNPPADEIVGARTWLAESTGIPAEKINGFRCARRGERAVGSQLDSQQPVPVHGCAGKQPTGPRLCPSPSPCRRAPFLLHSPDTRATLAANGFLYDSSISDNMPSEVSPSVGERTWPYTMDDGIPQACSTGAFRW